MWQGRGFKTGEWYLMQQIYKDLFKETLDSLTEKQFIKCNAISNRECLSLPKDSE